MKLKDKALGLGAVTLATTWVLFPAWLSASRADEVATEFMSQARKQGVEAKVVDSIHYMENPFTWLKAKPRLVMARKRVDDAYIVLYANIDEDGIAVYDKSLVSADCSERRYRVVTRQIYRQHVTDSGYDVVGRKLPEWDMAGYSDMLSVMLFQEIESEGNNPFFKVACDWETM